MTQDPAYLEPYMRALATVSSSLAWVELTFSPEPQYVDEIRQVQNLKTAKFAELETTVRVAKQGEIATALRIVKSNSGKNTMDRLREIITSI